MVLSFLKKKKESVFGFLISFLLILMCFESSSASYRMSKEAYLFFNSFFGYKFFNKSFSFFFSDIFIIFTLFFCFYLSKEKKRYFFIKKSSKYFLFLFIILTASAFFSSYRTNYKQILFLFNFFSSFLFFGSIVFFIKSYNIKKFLSVVLSTVLILSLFQCLVGFFQYFFQKSIGLKFLHEAKISKDINSIARFEIEGGYLFFIDYLLKLKRETNIVFRATGTLAHANVFGGFMFFSTISTYYFFIISKKRKKEILFSIFLFLQIFSIFLSFSRAAIFGFLLMNIFFFSLFYLKKFSILNFEKKSFHLNKIKKLAFLLFVFLSFSSFLLYPQLVNRGGIVNYNKLVKSADSIRVSYNKVSLNMMKTHPISGIGFNNFSKKKSDFIPANMKKFHDGIVHNIYLLFLTEGGVFAFSFFLIFIFSIFINISNLSLISSLFISFFIGILFIGSCDHYLMLYPQGKLIFFFVAAILGALGKAKNIKYEILFMKIFNNLKFFIRKKILKIPQKKI